MPDVSLTSAGHDPYLICLAGSCQPTSGGQIHFAGIAGTSAATPSFAGIMALVKQKTGTRLGQANYTLYRLAAAENFSQCNTASPAAGCIFNDITTGGNSVPGQFSAFDYTAGTGYDLATGLGSLNVGNLVNQWNNASGSGSDVHITIDVPGRQSKFSGEVQFAGWAISDTSTITSVTYAIDGVPYGAATYGANRLDVCAAYPNRAGCPNVGWSFLFDTNLLPDGTHALDITATASNGQGYTVSSRFEAVNDVPPMRVFIDSPTAQSGAISGPTTFAGWAIDDFAAIGNVAVSIDGVPQGLAVYGGNRPDVCAVYPARSGCPNVGWTFSFDTSLLSDGSHALEIRGVSVGGRQATTTTHFQSSNASRSTIKISIDRPNAQSPALSGITTLGGWAIDSEARIDSVSILVDSVPFGNTGYGGNRADACPHNSSPGCPNVGWNAILDTTLLSDGSHMLQVTATSSTGEHATVTMPFNVANFTGNSIHISIDAPAPNSSASAGVLTGGWAIDDQGSIVQIAASVDGVVLGNAIYGAGRPDVCAHFPGRGGCPNVGWNFPLDTTLLSNGTHTLELTVLSSTGKHATVSRSFQVANWTVNPTRICIDAPNSSMTPLAGIVGFGGWAIDDYSAITNVAVSVDGISYGNAAYGGNRADVCNIYPARFGCPNVGWGFSIDTTLLADGVHLLEVKAKSSEGWQSTTTAAFTVDNITQNRIRISIDPLTSNGGAVSGQTNFTGWAFSNNFAWGNILISIDNVSYGNAVYGSSRPEVCQQYPYVPFCPNVGWSFALDTTLLSNGPHKLGVTFEPFPGQGGTVTNWFTVANPPAN